MSRFKQYGELDDARAENGDGRFAGVDGSRAPQLLEEGLCADALNVAFPAGEAITRPGFVSVGWGVERGLSFPFDFLLKAAIRGAGDAGTGEALEQLSEAVKVDDRGVKEFKYSGVVRYAGRVGPSVGDVVIGRLFGDDNTFNGARIVSYAGDREIRVVPSEADWDVNLGSSSGTLDWEGSVGFGTVQGFGEVFGAGVFSDPNGREGVILALARRAVLVSDGQAPQYVRYPEGVLLSAGVRFVQAFDRVLMLRGFAERPLVWRPVPDMMSGPGVFELVGDSAEPGRASFVEPIPNAAAGVEFNGRLYLQYGRDQVAVSDVYDYTHYDPVLQAMRVNEGSDDSIVRIMPFGQQRLLVFFSQSIWVLNNVFGDLSQLRGDVLTRERGAVAHDAIVQMGPDVWFLSEGGVYSLAQTDSAQLQSGARAISAPVEHVMRRVNWAAVRGAQAISHDGRFFLALPVDGATWNNALLVFDQQSGQWWGQWRADGVLDVQRILRTDDVGRRRVIFVNGAEVADTRYAGAVLTLEDGGGDRVCGDLFEVESFLLSRRYSFGDMDQQRLQELMVVLGTNGARFGVDTVVDGVGEVKQQLAMVVPDRTKYKVWGKAQYDVSNVNDDHGEPWREDYSIVLPAEVTRGRLVALVSDDVEDLVVKVALLHDYRGVELAPVVKWDPAYVVELAPGDLIDASGFLALALDRQYVVDSVDVNGFGVCVVSAAAKAAIVAECDARYGVDDDGFYTMPDDPNVAKLGVRSWAFSNALTRGAVRVGSGFNPDLMQVAQRRLRVRQDGAYVQVALAADRGRVALMGIVVGARKMRRTYGERM